MFQLIEPIWLLTLAGITIPVIIHLWNIRKGKTLKVGSIALLTQRSRQNARSFRLSDLLLLLLRCLFIGLLSILLSKPFWNSRKEAGEKKGWLLLEPGSLGKIYPVFKTSIDSLLREGFELHYFSPGFSRQNLQTIIKDGSDTVIRSQFSYWPLLKLLERKVSKDLPLHLFTEHRLSRFSGTRPSLSLDLKWYAYTNNDDSSGLATAYLTLSDSIRVIEVASSISHTSFSNRNISVIQQRESGYNIRLEEQKLLISQNIPGKNSAANEIEVDTSSLQVTIYTDTFHTDALYLKAALQAIQQYTDRKINTTLVKDIADIMPGQDWLFWLSEKPVVKNRKADVVFMYENGKPVEMRSNISIPGSSPNATPLLYKLIPKNPGEYAVANTVWTNGYGNPVLLAETIDHKNMYHFFSRFDPEWNGLVWSGKFPEILWKLILQNTDKSDHKYFVDNRVIDTLQMLPKMAQADNAIQSTSIKATDLSYVIWAVAFIVLLIERILSFNHKKQEIYG